MRTLIGRTGPAKNMLIFTGSAKRIGSTVGGLKVLAPQAICISHKLVQITVLREPCKECIAMGRLKMEHTQRYR